MHAERESLRPKRAILIVASASLAFASASIQNQIGKLLDDRVKLSIAKPESVFVFRKRPVVPG
jgi:hypothetical protein